MQGQLSEQIAVATVSRTGKKSMSTARPTAKKSTKTTKDASEATSQDGSEERRLSTTERYKLIHDHQRIIKKLKDRITTLVTENTAHLNVGSHRDYQGNCQRISHMQEEITNQKQQLRRLDATTD